MSLGAVLGIASAIVVVGFIVFAFRQGLKVKPDAEHRSETIHGVSKRLPRGIDKP